MPDLAQLGEQAEKLTIEVARLHQAVDRNGQRVDGLREDLALLADRQTRGERRVVWVAVGAVIAFLLAALTGLALWRSSVTDRRLDAICPVLALVVGGANPNTRPPGPARDAYIQSIEVMHKAYDDLGCSTPLVPGRTN